MCVRYSTPNLINRNSRNVKGQNRIRFELTAPALPPGESIALSTTSVQPSRPGASGAASVPSGAVAPRLAPITAKNVTASGLSHIRAVLGQLGVLANTQPASGVAAPAPAPNITFDGLDFATWGAGHPPDTNGDVGPDYYIQTINTSIGIYNKATGVRVAAFTFNTFMSQGNFGNLCDTEQLRRSGRPVRHASRIAGSSPTSRSSSTAPATSSIRRARSSASPSQDRAIRSPAAGTSTRSTPPAAWTTIRSSASGPTACTCRPTCSTIPAGGSFQNVRV